MCHQIDINLSDDISLTMSVDFSLLYTVLADRTRDMMRDTGWNYVLSDQKQLEVLFHRLGDSLEAHLRRDYSLGYSEVWDSPVS